MWATRITLSLTIGLTVTFNQRTTTSKDVVSGVPTPKNILQPKGRKRVNIMANTNKKMTKKEMLEALSKVNTKSIKDENLVSRLKYTLAHAKSALYNDVAELADEVSKALVSAQKAKAPAPIEASLKAPAKKGVKAPAKKTVSKEETEEIAEAPVKGTKKSDTKKKVAKKSAEKKAEIETLPAASSAGVDKLPQATMFPAVIEHEDLGKLVACTGKYTTYAEIFEALEADKTLYFAGYWTKRHIKEYRYSEIHNVKAPKNGFPHDLDIAMAVVPCETVERVYAMSRYTEAMYRFEGEDFQYLEDTDPRSGKKFRIRVSAGMEFEIYAPADEVEAE